MRRGLPERSFWTVEDLARDLGTTPDAVYVYADDGALLLSKRTLGGKHRLGVTAEEKRRFEGAAKEAAPARYNAVERKTHLHLIGAMAALWVGSDPRRADAHYTVRDTIAQDVERAGFKMLRGRETDANAIKEGIALLIESVSAITKDGLHQNVGESSSSSDGKVEPLLIAAAHSCETNESILKGSTDVAALR